MAHTHKPNINLDLLMIESEEHAKNIIEKICINALREHMRFILLELYPIYVQPCVV